MTRQKSLKTRVRTRMEKTGESYTAARRHVVSPPADVHSGSEPIRDQRRALVRERTGRTWDEWFGLLDAWAGADAVPGHTAIARWLTSEHGVDNWWAQTVTVAYEQARGLRAPGQSRTGFYSVSATRTVGVPVERLFEALADATLRRRWLPDARLRVRTATAPKSWRADWLADGTRVVVGFAAKGTAKAQIAVLHEKLGDAAAAERAKAYWRDRLAELKRFLES